VGTETIEGHVGDGLRRGIMDDGGLVTVVGGLVVHRRTLHMGRLMVDRSTLHLSGLMVDRGCLHMSSLVVSRWSSLVVDRWSLDMSRLVVNRLISLMVDLSRLVVHRRCLGEQVGWLLMSAVAVDGSWDRDWNRSRGIADGLGHRRLVDIVADPGVLLVDLRVGRGHRLGVVGDGAIEAPHHILLGVGHCVLVGGIANAWLGNQSRPGGSQEEQQTGGDAEELEVSHVDGSNWNNCAG